MNTHKCQTEVKNIVIVVCDISFQIRNVSDIQQSSKSYLKQKARMKKLANVKMLQLLDGTMHFAQFKLEAKEGSSEIVNKIKILRKKQWEAAIVSNFFIIIKLQHHFVVTKISKLWRLASLNVMRLGNCNKFYFTFKFKVQM